MKINTHFVTKDGVECEVTFEPSRMPQESLEKICGVLYALIGAVSVVTLMISLIG